VFTMLARFWASTLVRFSPGIWFSVCFCRSSLDEQHLGLKLSQERSILERKLVSKGP
jgi:hypothetical protein